MFAVHSLEGWLINMSNPYKTRAGGATVTVFVPYDCNNHCPFCINKQEYEDCTGFSLEAILRSIRTMDEITPACDFVFTGGEPLANLDALQQMLEWVEPKDTEEWVKQIAAWDHENPLEMRRDKGMTPQMIMEGLNQVYDEVTYVTDVGQHQMWASQYLDVNKNKRMITSGGLGTMGFGFPAALGAKMGHRDRDVVCITGDGGFQMNMQEMATAVVQQTPITVCLLNNYYLGMVRQMQQLFYGKRYSATCLRRRKGCPEHCKGPNEKCPPYVPDFMKWAESYGAHGIRVTKEEDIIPALEAAKQNTDAPTVIEFMVATEEIVLPMVPGGNPMNNMILKSK